MRVGVGRSGDLQAKKLVLGIKGHCTGSPKAIELDPVGHRQGVYRTAQGIVIQPVTNREQCTHGRVEDAVGKFSDRVAVVHGELRELTAAGQHLRQL